MDWHSTEVATGQMSKMFDAMRRDQQRALASAATRRWPLPSLPSQATALRTSIRSYAQLFAPLATKSSREENSFPKQFSTLDRQIDNLVYELYDLTPEEIAIVERTFQVDA
jgi:hypothetical protein